MGMGVAPEGGFEDAGGVNRISSAREELCRSARIARSLPRVRRLEPTPCRFEHTRRPYVVAAPGQIGRDRLCAPTQPNAPHRALCQHFVLRLDGQPQGACVLARA